MCFTGAKGSLQSEDSSSGSHLLFTLGSTADNIIPTLTILSWNSVTDLMPDEYYICQHSQESVSV